MNQLHIQAVERNARRKIAFRLLPFLWLLYMIAFVDRVNVAYAALEMSHDLHFSDRVFGQGGSFSSVTSCSKFPAPSLSSAGARRWIARIMISWGIVTALVGLVHTSRQFYIARFVLGMAEAGVLSGRHCLSHPLVLPSRREPRLSQYLWRQFPSRTLSALRSQAEFYLFIGMAFRAGAGYSFSKEFRRSCSESLRSLFNRLAESGGLAVA
jgi:hypothetical protein